MPRQQPIYRAVRWWISELAGVVPPALWTRLSRQTDGMLQLNVARDRAELIVQARGGLPPTTLPVSLTGSQSEIFTKSHIGGRDVKISLDEACLFRPVVELPLAAEKTMEPILRHQLERLVPLEPNTLRFIWQITERVPSRNRLRAELCIVKQSTLDSATALAGELGLTPRSVVVAGAGKQPATIWRPPTSAEMSSNERLLRRGLEGGAILFTLAAYALLVWNLDARAAALRHLLSDILLRTKDITAMHTRTEDAERTLARVEKRLAEPSALEVLDALTKAMPLDSSISEFHMKNGQVEIVGLAPRATALLSIIEKTALFKDPTFEAPITANAGSANERYELRFDIRERSGR